MVALAALGVTRLIHGSLVSHATDKATYGLVGTLLATTIIASLILPGGVSSAASKFIAFHRGRDDPGSTVAAHRFLSRLGNVGAIVLGVGAAAAARAMFQLSIQDTVAVGLLTAVYSLYSVQKAALYGFGRVASYARLELATSSLTVAATVLVVATGQTFYLWPLIVGYGVFAVGARLMLRAESRARAAAPTHSLDRREMVGYVAIASLGTLAGMGFLQGTQILAAQLAEVSQVAFVTAAVTLVAPLYFLPRALGIALFPAMAVAHGSGDADSVRRQSDTSTRALATILAPVFAAGAFLAPEVLTLFGGAGYDDGAPVLRLLLASTFFGVLAVPSINALSSGERRRARIPAWSALSGCLVGLAVVAVLAGSAGWGANGVGVGYLVGAALSALLPIGVVWRLYAMPWAGPLGRSIVMLAVTSFAAAGLDRLTDGGGRVAVHVVGAVVAALAVVLALWPQVRWLRAIAPRRGAPAGPPPSPQADQRADATPR
jgi:O-antigen/teichoic acid export membrane protein